ncbi:sugar ABC transporter ATP-binding protein [Paracoccus laeviglucosivorans]|uniref:Monosaccharide ABC transporter ATP-binding protein, CUT2 family n=1 Tax=Paracoccus laeviglucosivorans TaxID=1197861 RepID=A0A521F790_9RHOB|nr:sugar ABC transporter ATP-binding protein [Paracoccus laeviglucosivorans]SMO91390.1 monosaccharide ABC transporter ATP-binding protein, CUT2 family [Paracoccus laeviglucosivorans]
MTTGNDRAAVVVLDGASKSFGALKALDRVDLSVGPGECLGLVGHNGAGKSTLVNLITGLFAPTEGGVSYPGAADHRAAGIRSISQEGTLCPNLTVLENLQVTQRDLTGWGWRGAAAGRVMAALDAIFPGHRIRAHTLVIDMTLAEQQMVEIAIGFAEGATPARLVVLDEPTSSLDASIAAQLMTHIRRFCAGGGAVIFISHMLGEIFDVATRIVVMRDGRSIADRPAGDFTRQGLVDAMGHVADDDHQPSPAALARALGDKSSHILRTPEGVEARRGEIVGLAGLAGHGQAEALARFYLSRSSDWRGASDPQAVFVAGDRKRDGVMPVWSIRRNLTLAALDRLTRWGLIDHAAEARIGSEWQKRIGIRTPDMGNPILSLSGGNQQKALFARALATQAPVVVMDDPMRGVDIGTKTEVYDMIRHEAANGRTFLWYSTEMDEIRNCDRVFVFRDGAISAELEGVQITEEAILAASFEFGDSAA